MVMDSNIRPAAFDARTDGSLNDGLSHAQTMLIPTRYKIRLSREFSYPVGAEVLSMHLGGVPHFSEFQICFSDVVSAWKSKFQRIIAEGAGYEILTARFWSPFEIYVYPVLRNLKHGAQEALVSNGLPALRNWILRQGSPSSIKCASGRIVFSPSAMTVRFEEQSHVS